MTSILSRAKLFTAVVITAIIMPASAQAAQTTKVQPASIYQGTIKYNPNHRGIWLRSSYDGKTITVDPGYGRERSQCSKGWSVYTDILVSDKKYKVSKSGKFSGASHAEALINDDQNISLKARWTVKGQFVTNNKAKGTITISGKIIQDDEVIDACKTVTQKWSARFEMTIAEEDEMFGRSPSENGPSRSR